MGVWQAIIIVSAMEQLIRREKRLCTKVLGTNYCKLLPSSDDTSFSGDAVEKGNYLVFISASFCHASRSHCINNVIMIAAVGSQLENILGPTLLLILFITSGVMGWLFTYCRLKFFSAADKWHFAKFQQGLGSSPCTYALAITAASILDPSVAVGPFLEDSSSEHSKYAVVSWISTVWAVFVAPNILSGKLHEAFLLDLPLAFLGTVLCTFYTKLLASDSSWFNLTAVNAATWLVLYHFKTFSKSLHRRLNGKSFQSSDHAAHFGGALSGLIAALLWNDWGMLHSKIAVLLSMFYLLVRFIFDI
uniref:Peptidase S54 rhomboid domain-containing protein n=1 Tax=Fibrocapsa japonica TaxID=94617 RepID=A0A7S2XZP1_9STRA|mmetsp:Transcript_4292/g.6427  ORF Transcript_4292/g.6427 Transcript_4292/m.6427 type:complete len:304 (+) Transcript_4292:63-974(+)